jgi:hypothetical protein
MFLDMPYFPLPVSHLHIRIPKQTRISLAQDENHIVWHRESAHAMAREYDFPKTVSKSPPNNILSAKNSVCTTVPHTEQQLGALVATPLQLHLCTDFRPSILGIDKNI